MRWLALLSLLLVPVTSLAASPEPSPAAMSVYDEGKRLYDGKDYAGALERFDRCAVMEPQVARWQYNRGLALKKLQRDGEAREAFHRSLALDPAYKAQEIGGKLSELGDGPPDTAGQGPAHTPNTRHVDLSRPALGVCGGVLLFAGALFVVWRLAKASKTGPRLAGRRAEPATTLTREQRDALQTHSRDLAVRLSTLEHGLSLGEDNELRAQVDRAAMNMRVARQAVARGTINDAQSAAGALQRAGEAIALGEARLSALRGPEGLTARGERRGCFFCARPLPTPESRHVVALQDAGHQVGVEACATCARGVQSGQVPKVTMLGSQHWSQAPEFDPYLHAYAPPAAVTESAPWKLGAGALAAVAGGVALTATAGAVLLDLAAAREAGLALEATAAAARSAGSRRQRSTSSDDSSWRDHS